MSLLVHAICVHQSYFFLRPRQFTFTVDQAEEYSGTSWYPYPRACSFEAGFQIGDGLVELTNFWNKSDQNVISVTYIYFVRLSIQIFTSFHHASVEESVQRAVKLTSRNVSPGAFLIATKARITTGTNGVTPIINPIVMAYAGYW